MQKQSTFYAVVSIFFFWGFMAASNGIFIPCCKEHFHLSQFQSQLIDSTFYGGYFIGGIIFAGPQIGVKYFFNPKIGVYGEIGYGKSVFEAGVSIKL